MLAAMIPSRPIENSAPLPKMGDGVGGEGQDVHLRVERLLGGVPHLAGLGTGQRRRLGDERVVLGVGNGGEVDTVRRLRPRHERDGDARKVDVDGRQEDVPCPRFEDDRAELRVVDALQLDVDAELLPLRRRQLHRERRALE